MKEEGQTKPLVLYVDDIQANLMLFDASFNQTFDVLLAPSGQEALEVLEDNDIEVLVTDQNMPGMTGNELLEIVTKKYPDIMRFMITAYTDYETVVEAINRGNLYGFFNKPYNIDDVKQSIFKSLEVRNLRIKNREMFQKLEYANESMRAIERSKTRFLSSITDEIRNPISKIMTAVHMIKDKIDSNELTDLLALLDVSVNRLESFSEATNHLIRLTDIDFELKQEKVSLKELVEVSVIDHNNQIVNKNIQANLDNLLSERDITGEFDMLQSCFSFILSFVIEHTADGGEIDFSLVDNEDVIVLKLESVRIDLAENEKKDLQFLSGQNELDTDRDVRLELMLSNQILSAHKGSFLFENDTEKGAISMIFPIEDN
ncbi:MAG TPA: response regulator [Bacteroidales bacterium]|nr:response regulator [Bacteroidales bacterium]